MGRKNYKLRHFEEAFTSENWIVRIFRTKKRNCRSKIEFKSKNIIPNNYEVLKVNKNNINENKNMNIDVKSESIPFGLEIIGGLASSLLLDSLLPLEIIFTAESIFLAYIMFLRNIWINNPKKLEEREKDREWTKIWQNSLESVEDPRMWFSSWFLNDAKFEDISLEDAKDFVTWAMYQNVPESLNDKELFELNKSISQIEIFTNHKFPQRGDKKTTNIDEN